MFNDIKPEFTQNNYNQSNVYQINQVQKLKINESPATKNDKKDNSNYQMKYMYLKNENGSSIYVKCYNGNDILNMISNNKQRLQHNQTMQCFSYTNTVKAEIDGKYHIGTSGKSYAYDRGEFKQKQD